MSVCLPVVLYRFGNWLWRMRIPVAPKVVTLGVRIVFGCWLPASAKLGRRVVLGYQGLGVVIHHDACIGNDVLVGQGVTIGGTHTRSGVPVISDGVYVGAGAKVLGPIRVGRNVLIGANAVVVKDVPDNAIVAGVPAKVIGWRSEEVCS